LKLKLTPWSRRGLLVFCVGLALCVGLFAIFNSLDIYLLTSTDPRLMSMAHYEHSAPPWYFLRSDYIHGQMMLAFFLCVLTIGVMSDLVLKSRTGLLLVALSWCWASTGMYCTRFFGHEVDDIHAATTAATRS
jgi:hypothetical protein